MSTSALYQHLSSWLVFLLPFETIEAFWMSFTFTGICLLLSPCLFYSTASLFNLVFGRWTTPRNILPSSGPSKLATSSFIVPDLVSHCKFKLTYHIDGDKVSKQSVAWLESFCPHLSSNATQRKSLHGLQAGELTAYCYHTATSDRLRIVSDFMNYLFHLDDISDGMIMRDTALLADAVMNAIWFNDQYKPTSEQSPQEIDAAKLARDFWSRCLPHCRPGTQSRFKETLHAFFEAINIQAKDREQGIVPDLESYINLRRDTSGCKPCWALIEYIAFRYSLDIELPDFVIEHPVMRALNQGTNDLVTWSNDIFSYCAEQSRGDTHNMIVILMKYHGHSIQSAIDYVGALCSATIDTFCENKELIPSWGPDIDNMIERYIRGLQDWIVGSLHWSFQTHRYFGTAGLEVKENRVVTFIPHVLASRTPSST